MSIRCRGHITKWCTHLFTRSSSSVAGTQYLDSEYIQQKYPLDEKWTELARKQLKDDPHDRLMWNTYEVYIHVIYMYIHSIIII